ncbi:EamA family transporter [Nocardiopsis sp. NPDC058631]|uniref:EamA family transporter n=1 Tax=Nocardiopsis sp. NPDC058631 TaxID=3346566 RepID=UPI003665D706
MQTTPTQRPLRVRTLPDATGILWGLWPALGGMALLGSSVAVIGATSGLPAFGLQGARYAVAAVAVVVLARLLGRRLVFPRGLDVLWVVGGALSGLVGFNIAVVIGTAHAEPAVLGAAVACIPIVLSVAGPLTRGRRPPPRLVAAAVVVSLGAVAVTGWGTADALGILMALSLIALEAGLTLLGAPALPRMGAWSYTAATAAVAALVFSVLSIMTERAELGLLLGPASLGAVAYLGVVATALAFVLWFTGVERVGAGSAGLAAGAAAPAAALIGALFGAPLPTLGTWLGMTVIGAGLAVAFAPLPRRVGSRSGEVS